MAFLTRVRPLAPRIAFISMSVIVAYGRRELSELPAEGDTTCYALLPTSRFQARVLPKGHPKSTAYTAHARAGQTAWSEPASGAAETLTGR